MSSPEDAAADASTGESHSPVLDARSESGFATKGPPARTFRHEFSDVAFERLFDRGSSKDKPDTLERVLKALQIISVVVGAVWALYRFTDFQKEHDRQLIDLQKLSLQREAVTVKYMELEKAQALEDSALAARFKKIEIQAAEDHRLQVEESLKLTKGPSRTAGTNEYTATLRVALANASQTQLEVTFVIVRQFLGTMVKGSVRTQDLLLLNGPGDTGPISWLMRGYTGKVYVAKEVEYPSVVIDGSEFTLHPGGSGTGVLHVGERRTFEMEYVMAEPADSFVGFVINIAVNGGQEPEDQFSIREWRRLTEASGRTRQPP